MSWQKNRRIHLSRADDYGRIKVLAVFFMIFFAVIAIRLFDLQILKGDFYEALAMGQHELYQKLFPERGSIYAVEERNGKPSLFPLVANQELPMLYAVPKDVANPLETAEKLFEILGLPEEINLAEAEKELFKDISPDLEPEMAAEIKQARREKWLEEQKKSEIEKLFVILAKANDPYEPIRHRLTEEQMKKIESLEIKGLAFKSETWRFYPEKGMGGQVFGFWGFNGEDRNGIYGLEGYFNGILSGKFGELRSERDPWGNIIAIGRHSLTEKVDGSDLILTLDRAIQFKACQAIADGVKKYEAEAGAVAVMDPKTGAILAMCGAPDYDPNDYGKAEDINAYNNLAIFRAYEPGSIFKPITMAAALDLGKIEPETTYEDTGSVKYGPYNIRNFADKVYGKRTMIEVLDNSINTGAIFAMEQIKKDAFTQYVKDFNFGELTGIELDLEVPGNIANLDKKGDIYAVTASYGQGITVTPLQMLRAFAAIANGGKMMKPYIVSQIIDPKGEVESFPPQAAGQIISPKTAMVLGGMLVSVVENGHAQRAGVSGYRVAGKTGTAQVASAASRGYSGWVNVSFVGFAPFSDPKFAMIVVFFKPKNSQEAAISSAPVFADIAKFILQYYNVPYDAPVKP